MWTGQVLSVTDVPKRDPSDPESSRPHHHGWGQDATHIVEDVSPALHGDTLEHCQDGKQDVVKIGDAKVGSWPVLPAFGVTLTLTSRGILATGKVAHRLCICVESKANLKPKSPSSYCPTLQHS